MKVILTDIEGTTSSISFVKEVLFPYAYNALPVFIEENHTNPDIYYWLEKIALELNLKTPFTDNLSAITQQLQQWISDDKKHTALKALQGIIWQAGYKNGDFTAHIYPDAVAALNQWHQHNMPLYVYSSGSVAAQKLFFGHSDAGNLAPLFSGWFDTEIGGKRDVESYIRIANRINIAAENVMFLSDIVEELNAARTAGMSTVLIDRIQDYPTPRNAADCNGHLRVERFDQILS